MGPSQQRKLLRMIVKRNVSGAGDQKQDLSFMSLLPHPPLFSSEEKKEGWLESTTAPRAGYMPKGFSSAD